MNKRNKKDKNSPKHEKNEKSIFDQNKVKIKEIGMGTFKLVNFEHFRLGYKRIFSYDRVFKDAEVFNDMIAFVPYKYKRTKK